MQRVAARAMRFWQCGHERRSGSGSGAINGTNFRQELPTLPTRSILLVPPGCAKSSATRNSISAIAARKVARKRSLGSNEESFIDGSLPGAHHGFR